MKILIDKNLKNDRFAQYKRAILKFTIKQSILKTHFKELMKISSGYDSKEKTGYISKNEEKIFEDLVFKIEASDSKKCEDSHAKTLQKKIQRNKISKMSFEDYCEDVLDQHLALMSESEKNQAYQNYIY